ncbi:MAG: hypothetical protein GX575_32400 [Candidatus Anammoximicrobium sp.]|nr:hypothetical protein [Candidatus Anammoximicrobium sp.]
MPRDDWKRARDAEFGRQQNVAAPITRSYKTFVLKTPTGETEELRGPFVIEEGTPYFVCDQMWTDENWQPCTTDKLMFFEDVIYADNRGFLFFRTCAGRKIAVHRTNIW